ncbi:uncharacterized protein M421DRAFT_311469 [Didymella exigua CBS 183.55]|uniref:Uncharacterized protein n=1 Tax=Didymella exigua CBS 183.55 TaxID=1150837 RepID=A0A6A5R926_9PLEO|nr:uncharacterized protein M421DRAFT_311469 [Didymella exigua CBS 183.55]KAF1923504.1 hypothetical protein M421DRAFT_311469 [Didymella exigua CBS 183.55]
MLSISIASPTTLPHPPYSMPLLPLAVVHNMPSFNFITPKMETALLECFLSATRLLPLRMRPSFVLIGGAANVFHGSKCYTEDVDVAASSSAIVYFQNAIASGTTQFKYEDTSQAIEFHSRQDFTVDLELVQLSGGFEDSVAAYETLHDGFIASRVDLLVLRGVTVADRGKDSDVLDF